MDKETREALKRVDQYLGDHCIGTMSSQHSQFIDDLWTLIKYLKKKDRRRK